MSTFKNKTVLVTGGANGIGRLIGLQAVKKGADNLVVWDIDKQAMKDLQQQCAANGYPLSLFKVDISDTDQIEEAARQVLENVGPVDILLNNAGIVAGKDFINCSRKDIEQVLATNISGVMNTTRLFLPHMIERQSGHIINIASAAGLISVPGMSVYTGSKWAVTGWSESLRLELEKISKNLRVTTVQPGFIDTGMFAGVKTPLFTPMLKQEEIAEKIIKAVESNKIILRTPFMVRLLPVFKGILPTPVFDFVAGRIFRVYESMSTFKDKTDYE